MKLVAFLLERQHISIRPAPVERPWMDATRHRFAYRCLPLNMANGHGWEILCPSSFEATWNGAVEQGAITIISESGSTIPAISHFGEGILTFHIPCVFRTEPGFDLMVQGPINCPKDAIAPLTGLIEADWTPYTFTMNWMFTRTNALVRFERDEPICSIFPIRRSDIEACEPIVRSVSDDPALEDNFHKWTESRSQFISDLKKEGTAARSERWQKVYYHGLQPGQPSRTRVRLKPFAKG